MTTLALILQAVVLALKFPKELAALIRLVEKTPEEKRQAIIQKVNKEMEDVLNGERPKWD